MREEEEDTILKEMEEFRLKKNNRIYSIKKISTLQELAKRNLISPDNEIFVRTEGRWIQARDFSPIAPFFLIPPSESPEPETGAKTREESSPVSLASLFPEEEIEELPEEFVEGIDEPTNGITPFEGPTRVIQFPTGFEQKEEAERPPLRPQSPSGEVSKTVSFEDWVAAKRMGRATPLFEESPGTPPGPEVKKKPSKKLPFNTWRVGIVTIILLATYKVIEISITSTANMQVETASPPATLKPKHGATTRSTPVRKETETKTQEKAQSSASTREEELRKLLLPMAKAEKKPSALENAILTELINSGVRAGEIRITPNNGAKKRPQAFTVWLSLKQGKLSMEDQISMVGLVIGKYIKRGRFRFQSITVEVEQGTLERSLKYSLMPSLAGDFFLGKIRMNEFLAGIK